MAKFRVCYEIVTPESAEHGDYAEAGYTMPGGWKYPIHGPGTGFNNENAKDSQYGVFDLDLRQAIEMMSICEDVGGYFVECDSRHNYQTGAETRYSLHFANGSKGVTPASYKRIARLVGAACNR